MPLVNIFAMSDAIPPMTISIQDYTKHMAEGGKKDASYIADMFEEKVLEYDSLKICTDVFYFDGASNVQKAGEVLMAKFPHSFCFHGGKHVRKYARAEGVTLPPSEELCPSGGSNSPAAGAQNLTQFGEKGKNGSKA